MPLGGRPQVELILEEGDEVVENGLEVAVDEEGSGGVAGRVALVAHPVRLGVDLQGVVESSCLFRRRVVDVAELTRLGLPDGVAREELLELLDITCAERRMVVEPALLHWLDSETMCNKHRSLLPYIAVNTF